MIGERARSRIHRGFLERSRVNDSVRAKLPDTGFSLLEVIVATAILTASSMVLLQLLSIGSKHQIRGERLARAQIVCHALLDQWLIDPNLRREVEQEPVPGESNWLYDAEIATTKFPGVIRVHLAVFPKPEVSDNPVSKKSLSRSAFELVRWMRISVREVVDE